MAMISDYPVMPHFDASGKGGLPNVAAAVEKKPRILLLVTRLAPQVEEGHVQQLLEQCGEVQAFRIGRGAVGEQLSFGFAQFGDPEAAWKACTCLSKRVLCGQEIKVIAEESAEQLIMRWREGQQAALKVTRDELEWELERKAVISKALIDAKVEELYGIPAEEAGPNGMSSAMAQRRQEIRDRENARFERVRKRKAWRMGEFSKELQGVEETEKRLRRQEQDVDDADRSKELAEATEKSEQDGFKLARVDEAVGASAPGGSENRAMMDMVDRVQQEPRDALFKVALDMPFLREEKILERKLRPWLERKIDYVMGGPQADLVEYVLRRVNGDFGPDMLISDLSRYLEDSADPLVERMWRMLVFELYRHGLALKDQPTKKGAWES